MQRCTTDFDFFRRQYLKFSAEYATLLLGGNVYAHM